MDIKKLKLAIEQAQKVCNEMNKCANKFILQDSIDEMNQALILSGVGCSLPSKEEYDQVLEHQFNKISKSKNPLVKRYFSLGFHFAYKFVTNFIMK
tara:strand:+ start:1152 stop:1439 length:288 start_codon:yes stop_codon:yes gene_type:complete